MKKIFLLIASALLIILLSSTILSTDTSKNTVEMINAQSISETEKA